MEQWTTWRTLVRSAVSLAFVSAVSMGLAQEPLPGGDAPITRARLAGARLESIDTSHSWAFKEKGFVLASGTKKDIPADLLKALLGPERKARRIEGQWDMDEEEGVLILTAISADGKQGQKEVRLKIGPAGPVRANVGKEQYNIFPGKR